MSGGKRSDEDDSFIMIMAHKPVRELRGWRFAEGTKKLRTRFLWGSALRCLKKQDRRMEAGIAMRSRNPDGNVPNVNWNDGKVNVNWTNRDNADPSCGARQAVSVKNGGLSARRLRI